jgi:molecular chaperone HscA
MGRRKLILKDVISTNIFSRRELKMLIQIDDPHQNEERLRCLGIDFGTTHCVAAVLMNQDVRILEHKGQRLIPSVIFWKGEVLHSVKRHIGQETYDKDDVLEMCTLLFRSVQAHVISVLGYCPLNTVVTIPAYFDDVQRSVVKSAAESAGLNVMRLLTEPTAAAIAYGVENQSEGVYAVYDWGGGTFDFSLLKMEQGVFRVLATGGDNCLGGDDIDQSISEWMSSRDINVTLPQARQIKEKLTKEESTIVSGYPFAKSDLEALTDKFLTRSFKIVQNVLEDAGFSINQLKGLILAGGSTKMPYVRRKVESFFDLSGCEGVNPDECVAVGAALQADNLSENADFLLLDITPLSLGIETWGGLVEKLIPKHSPLPASASQVFTTGQDGQTKMKIHVVQGEREFASDCRSLGYFEFSEIPVLPKGMGRVKVEFRLDANGLLTVTMTEESKKTQTNHSFETTKGLNLKMLTSETFASEAESGEEVVKRLWVQKSQMAEAALNESERLLHKHSSLFSEREQDEWKKRCEKLKTAVAVEDFLMLRDEMDMFLEYLQPLIERFLTWSLSTHVQNNAPFEGTHKEKEQNQ